VSGPRFESAYRNRLALFPRIRCGAQRERRTRTPQFIETLQSCDFWLICGEEFFYFGVEAGGDGGFGCVGGEVDGLAYADLKGAGAEPAAFAGFEFAEAAERDGEDRDRGLLDEQADAGTEGGESAVG
jgi:hypothetical protein